MSRAANNVARLICHSPIMRPHKTSVLLYGIPRGGSAPAYAVSAALNAKGVENILVSRPSQADIFIADISDSESMLEGWCDKYAGKPLYTLFDEELDGLKKYVFPWEKQERENDYGIPLRLLEFIGEDTTRGGLQETPERFLKAWKFWTKGYDQNPSEVLKAFEDGAEDYDQMVLVKNIPVYSHCEHHLAPFFGVAHVGYLPNKRIVGLSKINRLVDIFARRLQVQERLTSQIASALQEELNPLGVAVILECRHMCMESRGVCQQGHSTTTSSMHGIFRTEQAAREEFIQLIKG